MVFKRSIAAVRDGGGVLSIVPSNGTLIECEQPASKEATTRKAELRRKRNTGNDAIGLWTGIVGRAFDNAFCGDGFVQCTGYGAFKTGSKVLMFG
ncbi:MAG: hypothetical protein ACREPU_11670 [Rhodanobacteraceae bacterium]